MLDSILVLEDVNPATVQTDYQLAQTKMLFSKEMLSMCTIRSELPDFAVEYVYNQISAGTGVTISQALIATQHLTKPMTA